MLNPQVNVRLPPAVHDRLTRLAEALDARALDGARPLGKTGAATFALLSGLAAAERDLDIAPEPTKRTRKAPSKAKPPAKRAATKRTARRGAK